MITKQDLLEAIAECQGVRSPNANTAIKLAAFYTILDHLDESEREERPAGTAVDSMPLYSFSSGDSESVVFDGESEFAKIINGRKQDEIWPVMDELMSALQVMNGRLYNGVMRKLSK